jgi:pyrroline-5-carboxylate reductase
MKISVIGVGAMGGAFAEGLLKSDSFSADDITVSNPSQDRLNHFAQLGLSVTTYNKVAAMDADIIVIAVKPWIVESVIKEIKESFISEKQMLVVIAASVTGEQIKAWVSENNDIVPDIYIAIPNIAIAEKASMTFIVNVKSTEENAKTIKDVFDELGNTLVVDEHLLSAGTTLASCGIAYAMRYVRASVEGGVELGFKASDAQQIVLQTLKGAVTLLQANGNHPEAEIDKVTTPGGLTIKGLNEMEHAGFTSAVIRGLKASM